MDKQKTTMNPKTQEQSVKTAIQSQLAKIKKEEEDEFWISGEELYTEGSSDEEEYKTQSRSRRKVNSNQSSRASSANASVERRGRSPASSEIKAKSDHSADSIKDGLEKQSTLKNSLKSVNTSASSEKQRSSLIKSQETQHISITDSFDSLTTKDANSSEFSTEEDQTENTEISWKAIRGTEEEWIEKEISEVINLDNLICEMNNKLMEASKETLCYQYENREKLETILSSCPREAGKLAENTQQFFQLCPRYKMLGAGKDVTKIELFNLDTSNASLKGNNLKHQVFNNKDNLNIFHHKNELPNSNFELLNMTDNEEKQITKLMNDIENIDNKKPNFHNNPYVMDKKAEEILLELENKLSVRSEDTCNQEQPVELNDNISTANTIISTFDTVSRIS